MCIRTLLAKYCKHSPPESSIFPLTSDSPSNSSESLPTPIGGIGEARVSKTRSETSPTDISPIPPASPTKFQSKTELNAVKCPITNVGEGSLFESNDGLQVEGAMRKQPEKKAILKDSKSVSRRSLAKHAQFDEANIRDTYHPPGKDYGHMKIDEPKTPYRKEDINLDPAELAKKLLEGGKPKALLKREEEDEMDEQVRKRKEFEMKRKQHYDEYKRAKIVEKSTSKEDTHPPGPSYKSKKR